MAVETRYGISAAGRIESVLDWAAAAPASTGMATTQLNGRS